MDLTDFKRIVMGRAIGVIIKRDGKCLRFDSEDSLQYFLKYTPDFETGKHKYFTIFVCGNLITTSKEEKQIGYDPKYKIPCLASKIIKENDESVWILGSVQDTE